MTRYNAGEWYTKDPRCAYVPLMQRRGYMTDADSIAYDDVGRSEYFQDCLTPVNIRWFAGIAFQSEQSWWMLSIQQALGKEPFGPDDIKRMISYRSLLDNSATIARHFGFARIHGAANALERHGLCTIALDANERVVHVSPSAEHHLRDGLQISGGKLRARQAKDEVALARLISGICGKAISGAGAHVSLSRSNDQQPLVLYGCNLPDAQCDVFGPAVGLLVISDPERPQYIHSGLLADYFGLTPAEAGLAAALALGITAAQHAADHAISRVTVRNHLQALLRKTGTHRQAELIVLLNKIIPRR